MGKSGLHPFFTMISIFFGFGNGNEEPYFRLPNLSRIFLGDANLEKYLEGRSGRSDIERPLPLPSSLPSPPTHQSPLISPAKTCSKVRKMDLESRRDVDHTWREEMEEMTVTIQEKQRGGGFWKIKNLVGYIYYSSSSNPQPQTPTPVSHPSQKKIRNPLKGLAKRRGRRGRKRQVLLRPGPKQQSHMTPHSTNCELSLLKEAEDGAAPSLPKARLQPGMKSSSV